MRRSILALMLCSQSALAAKPIYFVFHAQTPEWIGGKTVQIDHTQQWELGQTRSDALRTLRKASDSVKNDLLSWSKKINRDAVNSRFEPSGNAWKIVQKNGWTVDMDATLSNFEQILQDPNRGQVNVVFEEKKPFRDIAFFQSRNITDLIGEGLTHYRGSTRARIHNVHTGASQFIDRLFEGDTFSFNTLVGPIDSAHGYVEGLVISGDLTQAGVGGGICQVSTTVFRALFSAGLPILERRNHRYQVSYYNPIGLDATIYQPTQDLRFKNDTGGSIWFQTEWNDRKRRLIIRAFGKPRAEVVSISDPVVLSRRRPPPDRYIVDSSLPVGRRIQIDWAAAGASVAVYRTFKDPQGKVLRSETLRSTYVPWPNTYRIGPSPAKPKTDTPPSE